jgi:predicted DNA-binding transcriptional regulator AlpA
VVDFPRDERGERVPEFRGMLRIADAARSLNVSRATFYRLDAQGLIPRGVRIGNIRGWPEKEWERWMDSGCPPREKWEEMKP